ncbi:MAG: hypothetical protein J5482_06000 [Oscillospiraceae bacterium]|nr:hypothetical protein [Oscillospiraceae bacterium]
MAATFKTALFGGFDREDVVSFIEKTAREHREQTEQLTAENNSLRQANDAMAAELAALKETVERFGADAEKYQALCASYDKLKARSETLESENAELRGAAEEYRSLKDHIAEIEISAHRRTEEFRAAAIAKLHETVTHQRDWCAAQQQRYAALNDSILQQIRAAQEAMDAVDLTGFREMDESLQALDRSLDE